MWCTAERRCVPHVCLRNPFPLFICGIPSIHSLPETWASWEPRTFRHLCIKSWLHHAHPFVAAAEKTCLMHISDCVQDLDNQWTIVEIEILATVVWKRGCQPFSCRCSQNVMHCRKEICSTCLFKESIPTIPLGIPSIHSLPEAWASWEPRTFRHLCIKLWLHHAHPFVAAAEKTCLMHRSGCQPLSCRCSQNVTHSRTEIYVSCLSKESIPAIPFGNSKHPTPTRSLSFLRAEYVPPSLH